jgi:putative transcriptional regulator
MGHKSLQGQFLLDGGNLAGSCFHRSVVLVCQHTPEGAFGLILTGPSDNKVGDVIEGNLSEKLKAETLFSGGPVDPAALSYLHSDVLLLNPNIMPGLSLGHSLEELIDLGTSLSPSQRIRVFAGYAGWSAGQLDDEMRRKSWLTHPSDLDLVFHPEPGEIWRTVLRQKGPKYRLLAESPDNLSSN